VRLRLNLFWVLLLAAAGVMSALYLWFALFPGEPAAGVLQYFTSEQAARGREYQRALQVASLLGFVVQTGFLAWFVFGGRAARLAERVRRITGGPGWRGELLFAGLLWLMLSLISLPFALFTGYFWQKRWGFYVQDMGGWWLDYFKGAGLELALFAVAILLFFAIMRRWPRAWWLVGAAGFSAWLVIQVFLWPVLISPLFNEFTAAEDPEVIAMVRELSQKAGLPLDRVLIMDASRRTTKANAYFSGLGATKRIVLYDNLLRDYTPDEVRAVVAHEMAHWRQGHIIQGLGWGIGGSFLVWGLLYLLVAATVPREARGKPHVLAVLLLGLALLGFLGSPIENGISRAMEREADSVAVALTGDPAAAVRLQVNLAAKNLSELSPAGFIEWFSYTHPSVLARIEVIEQAGNG